ncbi:MAG: helix-turn-helix transcriptional regulator [Sphingomonadales bacterium]|nr:helix-turn-helix transcriptional regulator [Sphingomonadales bacterium]
MLHTAIPTQRRTRGRPRREDVAAIEEVLLGVALKEFLEHGYGGASLARIVRNAGISKTTLWSRYADKAALFRAIMNRQIERMDGDHVLLPDGGKPDLAKGLLSYATHLLNAAVEGEMPAVERLLATEAARFPELGKAAVERTMLVVRQVTDFIRLCTRDDPRPCRDPEGVARQFIGTLVGWHSMQQLACMTASRQKREAYAGRLVELLMAARDAW